MIHEDRNILTDDGIGYDYFWYMGKNGMLYRYKYYYFIRKGREFQIMVQKLKSKAIEIKSSQNLWYQPY